MTETTPLALNCYLAEIERQATRCARTPLPRRAEGPAGQIRRLAAAVAGLLGRPEPAPSVRP
jgi:hypothetical protein